MDISVLEEVDRPTLFDTFLGFGVWGLKFRIWGLGFGVWGLGFRV